MAPTVTDYQGHFTGRVSGSSFHQQHPQDIHQGLLQVREELDNDGVHIECGLQDVLGKKN